MNVRDKVVDILSSYRNPKEIYELLEKDTLTPLALNSIEFIKLTVDLESEFEIIWGDEDLDFGKFESFSYLFDYIEDQLY